MVEHRRADPTTGEIMSTPHQRTMAVAFEPDGTRELRLPNDEPVRLVKAWSRPRTGITPEFP